jgi:pyridoxine kinase
MPKKIITIAGADSLSGGGIQADLATFAEYGLFGFSAITSIVTVVNEEFLIHDMPLALVREQLDTIFAIPDIAGIKVGLLPTREIIELVGEYLAQHHDIPVVVDPVMAFKETDDVLVSEIATTMKERLLPFATVVTPNLVEASILADMRIENVDDMQVAAQKIAEFGPQHVVVKGGNRIPGTEAIDVLFDGATFEIMRSEKLAGTLNNGAGCTFASAIASGITKGVDVLTAVKDAKAFVYAGIQQGVPVLPDLGDVWQGARRIRGHDEN